MSKKVAVIGCIIVAIIIAMAGFSSCQKKQKPEEEQATPAAQQQGTDPRFTQQWASNDGNKIDANFATNLATRAGGAEITPQMVKDEILVICGHDARVLAIWANALGLRDNPTEYESLLTEDKTYLSDSGITLYHQVEGALATTVATREDAPADGTNTGMNGNGFHKSASAGITGNRTGTRFETRSGKKFWLMDRCSNLVYRENVPNLPPGPTDEPPKTVPPTKLKKDPNEAPKKNTEQNDDKGPGEDTNGDGSGSTKEQPTNSNHYPSYDAYKEDITELKKINKEQKTGKDGNTPSSTKAGAKIDSNADKGTGHGGINTPTPIAPKATEAGTGKEINPKPGEAWGGPSD